MHPAHRHTDHTPPEVDTKSDWGTDRHAKVQLLGDGHTDRHGLTYRHADTPTKTDTTHLSLSQNPETSLYLIHPSIHLMVHPSNHSFIHLLTHPSIHPSIHPLTPPRLPPSTDDVPSGPACVRRKQNQRPRDSTSDLSLLAP